MSRASTPAAAAHGPGRRGRRGDAGRARPRAVGPRLPDRRGARTAEPRCDAGRRTGRTSSCSTWACPTSTACRSSAASARDATTPIVILSGRYEEREKVEALERGADDYVTKPFGVDELQRPAPGRAPPRRRAGRRRGRPDRRRPARARRRAPRGPGRRHVGRPHAARVRDPARPAGQRWPARHQGPPPAGGVGRGVPGRGQLRLRPRQPAPPEARRGGSRRGGCAT